MSRAFGFIAAVNKKKETKMDTSFVKDLLENIEDIDKHIKFHKENSVFFSALLDLIDTFNIDEITKYKIISICLQQEIDNKNER